MKTYTEELYYNKILCQFVFSVTQKILVSAFHFEFRNLSVSLIFVVPCIVLNSEIKPTRCNSCIYSSQWPYSTCFG